MIFAVISSCRTERCRLKSGELALDMARRAAAMASVRGSFSAANVCSPVAELSADVIGGRTKKVPEDDDHQLCGFTFLPQGNQSHLTEGSNCWSPLARNYGRKPCYA